MKAPNTHIATTFYTIEQPSRGQLKARGSKFIAYAFPIYTSQDARNHLQDLKKTHPKACHHCHAHVLGFGSVISHASDDGEPNASAGKPILNTLLSRNLTQICVIVCRYFGGSLLGIPGLIAAYQGASQQALNHAEIVPCYAKSRLNIRFTYSNQGKVMHLIRLYDACIITQTFATDCFISLMVRTDKAHDLARLLGEMGVCNEVLF